MTDNLIHRDAGGEGNALTLTSFCSIVFRNVQKLETNQLEGSITAAFSGPKRMNELNEFDLKYLNYRFVALNTLTNLSRVFRP